MQEFDLKNLWSQADERAEAWYESRRPELVATARKQNDSVLQRIRRLVLSELIFSAVVFVAMLWYWNQIHPVLEELAMGHEGVQKAFAMQAGRELRVIVESEKVTDQHADDLSFMISQKIQDEMQYPGQIKVTVIREKRAVNYAR